MSLTVVLRTCDHTTVHPERGPRFIDCSKPVLIKKCLVSLLDSITLAKDFVDVHLYVIDDKSTGDTVEYIKQKIEDYKIKYTFETCINSGYNASALRQFEICKEANTDWVYSVEDDYLHFPNCIEQLIKMGERFKSITGSSIVIRPDDDLFVYSQNNPHSRKPSIVLLGDDRHWRTLYSTHNTLFTTPLTFRDYWYLFASLASYFKQINIDEDKSINLIWERVPLFSPIPGLAVHISQNNEPPFTDYKSLWESIQI